MKRKPWIILAPFPPHRGGIAHYSYFFYTHGKDTLSLQPIGFRQVFPSFLLPKRKETFPLLDECSYLYYGWFPPSAWRIPHWDPPPEGFILTWWTVFLAPFYWLLVRRLRRLYPESKVIFWCHNIWGHEEEKVKAMARWVLQYGDGFIVHSAEEGERLEGLMGKSVKKATLFLPLHPLPSPLPEKEVARQKLRITTPHHLAFLGTLRPYKGLELLDASLPELLLFPDITLTIAGEAWKGTMRWVKRWKDQGVHVHPHFLSWEEMAVYLASADALLVPFTSMTASGILMMALSAGKPVIAADVPGIRHYVDSGKTGILFPPGDKQGLLEAVHHFFHVVQPWENHIRQFRENFTWERFFTKLQSFLASLSKEMA